MRDSHEMKTSVDDENQWNTKTKHKLKITHYVHVHRTSLNAEFTNHLSYNTKVSGNTKKGYFALIWWVLAGMGGNKNKEISQIMLMNDNTKRIHTK